jgi:hypothetical protein
MLEEGLVLGTLIFCDLSHPRAIMHSSFVAGDQGFVAKVTPSSSNLRLVSVVCERIEGGF